MVICDVTVMLASILQRRTPAAAATDTTPIAINDELSDAEHSEIVHTENTTASHHEDEEEKVLIHKYYNDYDVMSVCVKSRRGKLKQSANRE